MSDMRCDIALTVNGETVAETVDARKTLVDFLRDEEGRVYFVMAEVEMPRFQALPEHIPEEIVGHILHSVAADDNRFTNKKLSDRDYARKMLAKIMG